jgi:hypothetical protein
MAMPALEGRAKIDGWKTVEKPWKLTQIAILYEKVEIFGTY